MKVTAARTSHLTFTSPWDCTRSTDPIGRGVRRDTSLLPSGKWAWHTLWPNPSFGSITCNDLHHSSNCFVPYLGSLVPRTSSLGVIYLRQPSHNHRVLYFRNCSMILPKHCGRCWCLHKRNNHIFFCWHKVQWFPQFINYYKVRSIQPCSALTIVR